MKKKIIALTLILTTIIMLNAGIIITNAQQNNIEGAQVEQSQLDFDLYTSGNASFIYEEGNLTSNVNGEQKAILQDFESRMLDASFTVAPTSNEGIINGGIYLFASQVTPVQDGIDAINVQVERQLNSNYYKVFIFEFTNGTFTRAISNTIPLAYENNQVKVRVTVNEDNINVYLDGSDIPSITKKITSNAHNGMQFGFRSQVASQIFSDISVSNEVNAPENKTVKVLMVGNSYAQDTMTYAHEIAKADGINMVCGVLYYGGCTIKQHVEFIKGNEAVYTYIKNGGTDRTQATFFDVLYDEDWDYVTIQTGKGEQGLKETFYPYLPWLIALVENRLPSVEIGLFESWAVPKCYEGTGNSRLSHYNDNSQQMYESIISTFKDLKQENGVNFVVPSAEAFYRMDQTDICDNSVFETSFFRDSTAHANEKGRYMLGLTMYKAITGRTVEGNGFIPMGSTYGTDAGVTAEDIKVIQQVVEGLFEDYNSTNAIPTVVTLDSIEVVNAKTQYKTGNYFDYNSIDVYAIYSDGSKIKVDCWVGNLFHRLTSEDSQVVITYQDKSAIIDISVN
ncbi:MAG: DUF4886 domain-containing protein [Clostridiales bacterium]|nr:DUF4886 domain-containing protein [Clostridiales bacterium]